MDRANAPLNGSLLILSRLPTFTKEIIMTFKDIADFWDISEDDLYQKLIDEQNSNQVGGPSFRTLCTKENGKWLKTRYLEACMADSIKDASSSKCGKCGKLNLIYDDCGFFYTNIEEKYLPVCCVKVNTCER